MSSLADFSPEEIALLIKLPYKVGVWISFAEDEEGEADDDKEIYALEHFLKAVAKEHEKKPFLAEIVNATLQGKQDWPAWADETFHVTEEAHKAARLLKSKVSETEAKAYSAMLMKIARAVAQASGEWGDGGDEGFFTKLLSRISVPKENPMNVSAAEDSLLSELAEALKV